MDAHKAKIHDLFNDSTLFEIPFFQRAYVWNEELWARLIEDMEYVVKTNKFHFMGAIILKEGRQPQDDDEFSDCKIVVDGQQRLTTLLIFLKVLSLKMNQPDLFDSHYRISEQDLALQLGRNDVEAFETVTAVTAAEKIEVPASGSRIIKAYNYFVDYISTDRLNYKAIVRNVQFVRIDLNADEDEQQIFDSINSLGVNLTTSELLKNYFFSRDTVAEYENKWASVFEKDDETKAYWDTELETGRVKRAMIDIFFDAYFQLFVQDKKYNVSAEDKAVYARLDHLSQSYQHFINTYCGGDKSVVLEQMKDYASCFMQTFRPDYCDMHVPGEFGLERLNVVIFGLKTSPLIPYVLYIAKNVSDESERNKIYGILESYIMRRTVVHAQSNNYNKLFTSLILNRAFDSEALIAKLNENNESTTYIPSDEELKQGFDTAKLVNLQTRGILYLIESRIRPQNCAVALLGFNKYSLEHLMPKKWRNNWPACATDDLMRQRDSILLTLGNLAIIPQSLNASIRDGDWQTKKAGKGNKPGLDICAAGLSTMYDVLQEDTWDETKIQARAEWLFEKAKELWQM